MNMMIVELGLDATNDELREQMRLMKQVRETRSLPNVICVVRGFDRDPRELWQIPEVRAFCVRLVDQGFISYLDPATHLPFCPPWARTGFGALEVWLIANGMFTGAALDVSAEDVERFRAVLDRANGVADATVGPFRGGAA